MKIFRKFSSCIVVLLFVVLVACIKKTDVYAEGGAPYVIVSSYEVTNGEIVPGEEFDISVTVKNVDSLYTASNVVVSLDTMSGINAIYPSVPQVFVGDIEPQKEKKAVFSYKVDSQYQMDTASFYAIILSDLTENSVVLSAPVKLDDSAFTVLSKNVPIEAEIGDKISTSFYFRVRGEASLNNVLMRVLVDENEMVVSSIGNVKQGAAKTQNLVFSIGEMGEHSLIVEIEGVNQNGTVQITEAYNGKINIKESSGEDNISTDNTVVNMRAKRDYLIMGGAALLILFFSVAIALILRKSNRK